MYQSFAAYSYFPHPSLKKREKKKKELYFGWLKINIFSKRFTAQLIFTTVDFYNNHPSLYYVKPNIWTSFPVQEIRISIAPSSQAALKFRFKSA